MDDYYDFDPEHNIDYGKSPQGNEVLIINSREIFCLKKTGERTLNNNCTLSWCCKNTTRCNATVTSSRNDVDLRSDYNIVRKNPHSGSCTIGRSEVCVLKHINYLMRMRGGEIMQGGRKKYRKNEDRIEQFKANYMQDHNIMSFLTHVRLCINN